MANTKIELPALPQSFIFTTLQYGTELVAVDDVRAYGIACANAALDAAARVVMNHRAVKAYVVADAVLAMKEPT